MGEVAKKIMGGGNKFTKLDVVADTLNDYFGVVIPCSALETDTIFAVVFQAQYNGNQIRGMFEFYYNPANSEYPLQNSSGNIFPVFNYVSLTDTSTTFSYPKNNAVGTRTVTTSNITLFVPKQSASSTSPDYSAYEAYLYKPLDMKF